MALIDISIENDIKSFSLFHVIRILHLIQIVRSLDKELSTPFLDRRRRSRVSSLHECNISEMLGTIQPANVVNVAYTDMP